MDISVLIGHEIALVAAIVLGHARIEALIAVVVLISAEIALIFDFPICRRKLVVLLAGPSCSSDLRDGKYSTYATRAEQRWKRPHALLCRSKHRFSPDDQEQEGDEHTRHNETETYFFIK